MDFQNLPTFFLKAALNFIISNFKKYADTTIFYIKPCRYCRKILIFIEQILNILQVGNDQAVTGRRMRMFRVGRRCFFISGDDGYPQSPLPDVIPVYLLKITLKNQIVTNLLLLLMFPGQTRDLYSVIEGAILSDWDSPWLTSSGHGEMTR